MFKSLEQHHSNLQIKNKFKIKKGGGNLGFRNVRHNPREQNKNEPKPIFFRFEIKHPHTARIK